MSKVAGGERNSTIAKLLRQVKITLVLRSAGPVRAAGMPALAAALMTEQQLRLKMSGMDLGAPLRSGGVPRQCGAWPTK